MQRKFGILIGIVVVLALVVCLVPLKEVSYAVTVDYEDTETYYEDEPYLDNETYIEQVPLDFSSDGYVRTETREERHTIIIGDIVFQDEIVEVEFQVAKVDLMNLDNVSGDFTVSFSGFEPMFGEVSLTSNLVLDPGELETAECPAESIDDWSYEVIPSTKGVEMEREVTKYEQVEKQRTVIRQREETYYKKVTVLDYLLHY